MKYRIVIDSCGELLPEWNEDEHFCSVPLILTVDDEDIIDDDTFDQKSFLKKVADYPETPKSSCPSPDRYMKAFESDAEHIYAVTLSAELSGSYNSALLAASLYADEHPEKKVHVFNSCSASGGETLIGMKIRECEEAGMDFDSIVRTVDEYISQQHTYFVLENLDTLRKNGRLSLVKAFIASALKIKPVMGSTPEGNICQLDQARGINKALVKMAERLIADAENPQEKTILITHCNCPKRAEMVRDEIASKLPVKEIKILDTRGVSSMYANDGGIIAVL